MGHADGSKAVKLFHDLALHYHLHGKDDIADLMKEALKHTKEFYAVSGRTSKPKTNTIKFA